MIRLHICKTAWEAKSHNQYNIAKLYRMLNLIKVNKYLFFSIYKTVSKVYQIKFMISKKKSITTKRHCSGFHHYKFPAISYTAYSVQCSIRKRHPSVANCRKTRRGSSVDNRPSTAKVHNFFRTSEPSH